MFALALSLSLAAVAAAASSIDLSPILSYALQLAGLVLTGIATWLATRVATYFHVSTQSQLFTNVLSAVDRGIAYAQQTVTTRVAGDKIAVNNAVQAAAVNYVVAKLPGTLNSLGMTPAHVADLVTAKLPTSPAPGRPDRDLTPMWTQLLAQLVPVLNTIVLAVAAGIGLWIKQKQDRADGAASASAAVTTASAKVLGAEAQAEADAPTTTAAVIDSLNKGNF